MKNQKNFKKILTGILFLGVTITSTAQWSTPTYNSANTANEWTNGTVGIQSSAITGTASLDLGNNLAIRGSHLIYNSQNAVLDFGGGGFGTLYFRSLTTQGNIITGYNTLMTITFGGNVGIGINASNSRLGVVVPDKGTIVVSTASTVVGGTSGIEFNYASATGSNISNVAKIIGNTESGGGGDLLFQTAATATTAYATQMSILRGGNVGIGTANPTTTFEVHGSISEYTSNSNFSLFFGQDQIPANQYGEWGIQYTSGTASNGGLNFWKPGVTDLTGYSNFGNNYLFLRDNGYIGIGTGTPAERLDVSGADANGTVAILRGNVVVSPSTPVYSFVMGSANSAALNYGTSYSGYNAIRNPSGSWTCNSDGGHNGGNIIYGDLGGNLRVVTVPTTTTNGSSSQTLTDAQVINNTIMAINANGKVVIGKPFAVSGALPTGSVTTPGAYNLYVAGGILTEQVRVALVNSSTWADYVFANDYKLKPLNEVEQYLKENKHLPEVPSSNEVKEGGIDVATMDATLLKKIEELTLYVIQLQKENNSNVSQIKQLQSQIKLLSESK